MNSVTGTIVSLISNKLNLSADLWMQIANTKITDQLSYHFWLRSSYCLVVGMINFGFQFYGVVLGSSRCFETDVFSRPYQLSVDIFFPTCF